jgi:hypothetical protein
MNGPSLTAGAGQLADGALRIAFPSRVALSSSDRRKRMCTGGIRAIATPSIVLASAASATILNGPFGSGWNVSWST